MTVTKLLAEKRDHYYFTETLVTAEQRNSADPLKRYALKTVSIRTFKSEKALKDYAKKEHGMTW